MRDKCAFQRIAVLDNTYIGITIQFYVYTNLFWGKWVIQWVNNNYIKFGVCDINAHTIFIAKQLLFIYSHFRDARASPIYYMVIIRYIFVL